SNGATRGTLADGQARRARLMAETLLARGIRMPGVCLLAHADSTSLLPEFHMRMICFIDELRSRGIGSVAPRAAGEPVGAEDLTVVIGPISALLPQLTASNGTLYYNGREVVFGTNANVL